MIANGEFKEANIIKDIVSGRRIGTFFTLAEKVGASIEDQAAKGAYLIQFGIQFKLRFKASCCKLVGLIRLAQPSNRAFDRNIDWKKTVRILLVGIRNCSVIHPS